MRTEALAVTSVYGRSRRGPSLPGLVPILVGVLVLAGWMMLANPFIALPAAFRAGASASPDTLFLALVSAFGLVAVGMFAVGVTAYVAAMRALRRIR